MSTTLTPDRIRQIRDGAGPSIQEARQLAQWALERVDGPNGGDTKRLEWLFSRLNDSEIKRKVQAVNDVHAGGSMHGIRMTDWRHALDVTMQQYVDTPSATHAPISTEERHG